MTIKVHDLRPAPGANDPEDPCRPWRGRKGARPPAAVRRARPRKNVPAGFEGGQLPLHMRLPKLKGFRNRFQVDSRW